MSTHTNKAVVSLLLMAPCIVAAAPTTAALEALGRQDFTGQGTYHRFGMLRQQEDTQSSVSEALSEFVSVQVRANTMYFSSDNIFNTRTNAQSDAQLAEFLGASAKIELSGGFTLDNRFDAAYFRHQDRANKGNDINTRTFRQLLNYETSALNDQVSVNVPLFWQYTNVLDAANSNSLSRTQTYGTGLELTWLLSRQVLPTFAYNYFLSDPNVGDGKHKHDFNLGLTYIPIPGEKLFVSPSVQYSYEDFKGSGRVDQAWTPTLSVSWQPLDFLGIDAVVSYTDSGSNVAASEFNALTGTLFARLFWKWP